MANKVHVKTGDKVLVLTGKDRGKEGKILKVYPNKNRVVVEGINIVKKHKKPRSAGQQGGIIEQEAALDASNVMLVCPRCNKASRVERKILENGDKVRVCKKCKETIDVIKKAKKA
ncbi:MAG: 50S ribosomal protein L24 [Clostridiales bacterium]|nr:50S ribosomal protein L24 [Clostridiales bacterium]